MLKRIAFWLLAFFFTVTTGYTQQNLLTNLVVPYKVYTGEIHEKGNSYYIPSFIIKDSLFYPSMPYLKPWIHYLHKYDIATNNLIASTVICGDTIQADSIIDGFGRFEVDKDKIHIIYNKRLQPNPGQPTLNSNWALYYRQLDTNLVTIIPEKRITFENANQPYGVGLQNICVGKEIIVAYYGTDTTLPGSKVSGYVRLDLSGNILDEDTLGEVHINSTFAYHLVAEVHNFPSNRYLVSGLNLFPVPNGVDMFYLADSNMKMIDTFLLKPGRIYNAPDNDGYFHRYPNLVVLPTGSIIGGAPYYHFPAGNMHTALFKCLPANRYSINKLVTFKNVDAMDAIHSSRPSIHNLAYNKVDNRIYYANTTHSNLQCIANDNYVQVICADTNLNVKWKKYIIVGPSQCAATHYTTSCDTRPGVLVAGGTYNTTDPQNQSLYTSFIYHLDSAIVANVDLLSSSPISDRIILSPNPAKDLISIKDIERGLSQIILYDFNGRKIIERNAHDPGQTNINIESLPSGYYLLRVHTNNGEVYSKKFLKE